MKQSVVLIAICWLLTVAAHAQSPYVRTFSMNDVKPNKSGWAYWFIPSGGVADTLSVKVSYVDKGDATHAPHSHVHDEVFILLEGEAIVHLNGEEALLHPGDGMYAPSNSMHGIRRADASVPTRYFVINRETPGGVKEPFPFREDYKMKDCHVTAHGGSTTYVSRKMSCGSMEMKTVKARQGRRYSDNGKHGQVVYVVLEGSSLITAGEVTTEVPAFSACHIPEGTFSSITSQGSDPMKFLKISTR